MTLVHLGHKFKHRDLHWEIMKIMQRLVAAINLHKISTVAEIIAANVQSRLCLGGFRIC